MPVVIRAESDFFRLAPLVDIMVNPANEMGAAGAGISKEFRDRVPGFYERWNRRCKLGHFKIGQPHAYRDHAQMNYTILSVATKRHWKDPSELEYIERALRDIREYLLALPERKYMTVAMPALGCGNGQLDRSIVIPMIYDLLDDLDNVVHLSMRESDIGHFPKYLAIVGPRHLCSPEYEPKLERWQIEESRQYVDECVKSALATWGLAWSDFDAVVSGGADGVDAIACGLDRQHPSYLQSLAHRYHAVPPIICKADWPRFRKSAGYRRNQTVADIGTHFVAPFKVEDKVIPRSVGTVHTLDILRSINKHLPSEHRKRVLTFGHEDYTVFNS